MCSVAVWPLTACRTLFVVVSTVFLACVELIWTQDGEVLKSSQKKKVTASPFSKMQSKAPAVRKVLRLWSHDPN